MNKPEDNSAKNVKVGIGSTERFFARGSETARRADAGLPVDSAFRVTFEDPLDLSRFLTPARVRLIREIRRHEDSVSGLARRLRRDPSSVRRDVTALEKAGLVLRMEKVNPGHGRMMVVRPTTERRIVFLAAL